MSGADRKNHERNLTPYFRDDFEDMMPRRGIALFRARQAIGLFLDALKSGYAENILPEPKSSQKEVDKKVTQIDTEWNKELHRGKPKSYRELNLLEDLDDTQKLALIDTLHKLLK